MAVNLKLVLAEALAELKKSEAKEAQTDRDLEKMAKANSSKHDWPSIKRAYSAAYDNYIRGLELINYCRRTGIDHKDTEMTGFCAEKMKEYFERCEKLRTKESNVLTSVRDADNSAVADSYLKEGYTWGEYYFVHQRKTVLKGNNPIEYHNTLKDGAYYLQVKNYDDYAVASPQIKVQLVVRGRDGRQLKQQKIIPALSCWGKNIGVVASSEIMLRVISDGLVRSSQVEVSLRELVPPPETHELKQQLDDVKVDTSWVDSLPALPGTAPAPSGPPPQGGGLAGGPTPTAGGGPMGGLPDIPPIPGGAFPPMPNDLPPPDPNNYGFGLIMPQGEPGVDGHRPAQHADPNNQAGGAPNDLPHPPLGGQGAQPVMGTPAVPGQYGIPDHTAAGGGQGSGGGGPDSTDMLGSLAVPGGNVGSPVMGEQVPSQSSDGFNELSNLEVPNIKKAKEASPSPYFDASHPGGPPQPQQGTVPPSYNTATAGGSSGPASEAPLPKEKPVIDIPPVLNAGKPDQTDIPVLEARLARVKRFNDYYLASSAGEKAMAQAMTAPEKYLNLLGQANPETKELASKIVTLPEPTELGMDFEDMGLDGMDLDMADLEAGNF